MSSQFTDQQAGACLLSHSTNHIDHLIPGNDDAELKCITLKDFIIKGLDTRW